MQIDRRRPDVMVIDGAFSEADRTQILNAVERAQFDEQRLGPLTSQRARERAVVEDPELAALLWRNLAQAVGSISDWFVDAPSTTAPIDAWKAVRCNPRSRLYRYGLGGDFSLHYDEAWKPGPYERSMLTVLVYMPNNRCVGGDTVVDGEVICVADWRVAIFDHRLLHQGKPVEGGEKTVLRNDVVATALAPMGSTNDQEADVALVILGKSRCSLCDMLLVHGDEVLGVPIFPASFGSDARRLSDTAVHALCLEGDTAVQELLGRLPNFGK